MRPTFSFFSLIFLLFFFHAITATNTNLIHETCTKCAQTDPNLSYNFCVTSLQSAPGSHRADDLRELGNISLKLIQQNVTSTRRHIKKLLGKKNPDTYVKACLTDCLDLYSVAVPTTKQALIDYKAERYDDVNIGVSSVIDASTTCEDGFKEKEGVVSPLTNRNNDTFLLSAISLSIIHMLS